MLVENGQVAKVIWRVHRRDTPTDTCHSLNITSPANVTPNSCRQEYARGTDRESGGRHSRVLHADSVQAPSCRRP